MAIDDLKVSHLKDSVVTRMVNWLRNIYKRIFPDGSGKMKVSCGKVHDSLGMNLDFSVPGEVKITMISYVKGMITDFSKYDSSDKTAPTPAGVNLFKVDPNCAIISEELATVYHNMTAKALFLTKRARPNISTAVAFLTTRVKKPDVHDWMKLVRLMKYLKVTPELPLILRADSIPVP